MVIIEYLQIIGNPCLLLLFGCGDVQLFRSHTTMKWHRIALPVCFRNWQPYYGADLVGMRFCPVLRARSIPQSLRKNAMTKRIHRTRTNVWPFSRAPWRHFRRQIFGHFRGQVLPPRAHRPRHADRLGIYTRINARNGENKEINENLGDGDWMHADSLGATPDVFARVSPLVGNCRFPLYLAPRKV